MAMIADAPGFDTLSYARRLKEAGVDERQAEAHAEAVRDAMTQGAASKVDLDKGLAALKVDIDKGLAALKADMDKGLAAVGNRMDSLENRMASMASKADLDKGLAALETRMTVRFVGIAIGIVVANAGVIVASIMALVARLP